jgi:hypothetical protein
MNSHVPEFIDRVLVNNRTKWWKNLKSETNRNRGRCLQSTLKKELKDVPEYRNADRRLFFFSSHRASSIDGRYRSIGVEEKYNPLDLKEHLIDGSIHRGFVWVIGNPQNVIEPVEAISLYVVQDNSSPITSTDVDLYFPVIFSLAKLNIHILFINGTTGDHYCFDKNDAQKPLPMWLAEKESPTIWDRKIDIVTQQNKDALEFLSDNEKFHNSKAPQNLPGFGERGKYFEVDISSNSKAAIMDYGNEWRLIELGLLLRSKGYDAAKVSYNKNKHKNTKDRLKDKVPAGRGVEKRVAAEMRARYSVHLDWQTTI